MLPRVHCTCTLCFLFLSTIFVMVVFKTSLVYFVSVETNMSLAPQTDNVFNLDSNDKGFHLLAVLPIFFVCSTVAPMFFFDGHSTFWMVACFVVNTIMILTGNQFPKCGRVPVKLVSLLTIVYVFGSVTTIPNMDRLVPLVGFLKMLMPTFLLASDPCNSHAILGKTSESKFCKYTNNWSVKENPSVMDGQTCMYHAGRNVRQVPADAVPHLFKMLFASVQPGNFNSQQLFQAENTASMSRICFCMIIGWLLPSFLNVVYVSCKKTRDQNKETNQRKVGYGEAFYMQLRIFYDDFTENWSCHQQYEMLLTVGFALGQIVLIQWTTFDTLVFWESTTRALMFNCDRPRLWEWIHLLVIDPCVWLFLLKASLIFASHLGKETPEETDTDDSDEDSDSDEDEIVIESDDDMAPYRRTRSQCKTQCIYQ